MQPHEVITAIFRQEPSETSYLSSCWTSPKADDKGFYRESKGGPGLWEQGKETKLNLEVPQKPCGQGNTKDDFPRTHGTSGVALPEIAWDPATEWGKRGGT